MKENISSSKYWSERYQNGKTGWDIGYPSTPVVEYCKKLPNKHLKILIPGAGNAHEAAWLWEQGFTNVYVIDIAKEPLENLKMRVPSFPESQLIHGDFFGLEDSFDLILEQTFFCALPPIKRPEYVQKMQSTLKSGAALVGVLFKFPLTEKGPPFGGSKDEYLSLFENQLEIVIMEECRNSIKPRMGNELFIKLVKA